MGLVPAIGPLRVQRGSPSRNAAKRSSLTPRVLGPGGLLIAPLVLLFIWELASRTGILPERMLAAPSTALESGWQLALNGTLWKAFCASALRAYSGLAIGVVAGVVLALLSGLTRAGEASIDGIVQIKRAIPTLALIPLAILWLGIGETMKIAIISFSVMIPVYLNTHAGLRGIDLRFVELARTVRLDRKTFVRRVALPGALPSFFTGLRLAVTTCWTTLIVLEQINTTNGIGYMMSRARDYGQTDVIVLGLVIYAVLGLASDAVVRAIERRALRYRKVIGS